MKRWLYKQLYRLACWLEWKGLDWQDLFYWSEPSPPGPLNDIITATLRNRGPELTDQLMRNNALLSRLSKRG